MTRQLSKTRSVSCTMAHDNEWPCDICGTPKLTDTELAISMLGKSKWYQAGHMDAESLMNILTKIDKDKK